MQRKTALLTLGLAALVTVGTARSVRSDDWRQFRRDERRTAASRDRLQVPLTDVWTVPGSGAVTWRGRAFFVGPDGARAALFCVDLRTGTPLWRRPLSHSWRAGSLFSGDSALQRRSPVAVTEDGIVYVPDHVPGTSGFGAASSGGVTIAYGRGAQFFLKAFRAADGGPVGFVGGVPNEQPVPQAVLFDGVGAPIGQAVGRSMQPFGLPLLLGNELVAGSLLDCLFRWTPGSPAGLLSIAHAEPQLGAEPLLRPLDLGGFPPTSAGSGLVIGGMSGSEAVGPGTSGPASQHLAVVNGSFGLWHRDYPWSLGYPTVERSLILTGAGGPRAENAVMAHDVATGAVRWVYPPGKLRPDSVGQVSGGGVGSNGAVVMGSRATFNAFRHSHQAHPGIAVSGGRAFAAVFGTITALDLEQGLPIWRWPLPPNEIARSVVASPTHVFVSLARVATRTPQARLVALRLADGKPEWNRILPGAGELALSDGLLFLSDGTLHAFVPAERTYRLAVDSPQPEDYDPLPGLNYDPQADAPPAEAPEAEPKTPERTAAEATRRARAVADATVVRLYWGDPWEKMVQQVRDRRAAAPGLPLLVSLDWLDPTRTSIRGGQSGWSARETAAFAAVCERLAREVSPQHLDLAPEVDVYLARDFRRLAAVRTLLRTAVAAVKKASPDTKVLLSLNREFLAHSYGKGSYTPFGKPVFLNGDEQGQLLSLLSEVDEIGLTSIPQSAFRSPAEIPGDYFLGLKGMLPKKPILLTRLTVRWDPADKTPELTQASYLKHLIQTAYWINAGLVAYPEVTGTKGAAAESALRVESGERAALAYWRDTLQWKRVSRLTAAAADLEATPR